MDLSQLDIPDTVTVHIEFPSVGKLYADDAKKKPMLVELFSPASDEAIAFKNKVNRKLAAKMSKKGFRKSNMMSPDELEEQAVERLIAMTSSVSNIIFGGKELSVKDMEDIYRNPKYSWINDQLMSRVGDWDDFLSE